MTVEEINGRQVASARALVEASGLAFEENYEVLVGVYADGDLIAAGARDGRILKMLTVRPQDRGGPALGELVTALVQQGYRAGHDSFFIFTAPENLRTFEALNFTPLVLTPRVALLEFGGGLPRYLEAHRHLVRPGENGAVVVNCNPFTLGHRYLIEEAAKAVSTLYLFLVREERSAFPFDTRWRLVREGVADLANVILLDSAAYAISAITFPAYFLRTSDEVARVQMELDLLLFARHLAPFFHIRRRFIGSEPYCRTTRLYGETMQRLLPDHGIEVVQIERRQIDGQAVSAYRVREALRREAYETVRRLVPPPTLNYLLSDAAAELRQKLRTYQRRH